VLISRLIKSFFVASYCLQDILLAVDEEENFVTDLPLPIRYKIAYEISLGMEYIQSWGLIHRDLKSGNILLNEEFDCFITDFGLSRLTENRMTLNLGTVHWMAPEVFQGDGSYTAAIDVFSFGIILWEIVARRIPYTDLQTWAIPEKVVDGLRPIIPEDCPTDLKQLMESCWDDAPERRPSFSQISNKLKPFVDKNAVKQILQQKIEKNQPLGIYNPPRVKAPIRIAVNIHKHDYNPIRVFLLYRLAIDQMQLHLERELDTKESLSNPFLKIVH